MMRKGRELYHQIFSETQRLLREIEEVRGRIQKLTEENFDLYYNDLSKQLTNLKERLEVHRELGGEFEVVQGNKRKLMEITNDGQIIISTISIGTKDDLPLYTEKLAYFRMEVKDVAPGEEKLYYFFQSEQIYYLENIKSIRRVSERTLKIRWSGINISKSRFDSEECDELEEIFGAKLHKYNRSKMHQINILKEFWVDMTTEYNCENEEHERLLLELWNTLFPDDPLTERITKKWSALGFQGKNPATDFRGGGVLSLKNLLYVATNYTEQIKKILDRQPEYPFASAGINVTLLIFNVFLKLNSATIDLPISDPVWSSDLLTLFTYSNSENAFEEFYFMFITLLDAMWIKMKAGYMDFPSVMKQTVNQMTILLSRRALSIDHFKSIFNQTILLLDESY